MFNAVSNDFSVTFWFSSSKLSQDSEIIRRYDCYLKKAGRPHDILSILTDVQIHGICKADVPVVAHKHV